MCADTVLPALICPSCEAEIPGASVEGAAPVASGYDDCLRKCRCGAVGASNAKNPANVTYIYRDPIQAIPAEVRDGADYVLANALNERNRLSKKTRFGFFSSSEDAITWVVFVYLLRSGRLQEVLRSATLINDAQAAAKATLLLWGVAVEQNPASKTIQERLRSCCLDMGERSRSLSEPDVVIDFGSSGVLFIEVKHRSPNDQKSFDYDGWGKYFLTPGMAWKEKEVRELGFYELSRNWCLAHRMADGRPFALVNLGPSTLFTGKSREKLDQFAACIGTSEQRSFKTLSWSSFLAQMLPDAPVWLCEFCANWRLAETGRDRTNVHEVDS